jgi:hypothetical protein
MSDFPRGGNLGGSLPTDSDRHKGNLCNSE